MYARPDPMRRIADGSKYLFGTTHRVPADPVGVRVGGFLPTRRRGMSCSEFLGAVRLLGLDLAVTATVLMRGLVLLQGRLLRVVTDPET